MGNEASMSPPQKHLALVLSEPLVVQPFPIVAVDARHCRPTPVEFEISNESTPRFIVRDPTTKATCFYQECKCFRSRKTLMDVRERGFQIPILNLKLVSFSSEMIIRPGPDDTLPQLLKMEAKVRLDTMEMEASFIDLTTGERCFMGVEGNWRLHQAFLWLSRGSSSTEREAVARVWAPGGNAYTGNEVYTLTIAPNVDVVFILSVCMALDTQWLVYQCQRDM